MNTSPQKTLTDMFGIPYRKGDIVVEFGVTGNISGDIMNIGLVTGKSTDGNRFSTFESWNVRNLVMASYQSGDDMVAVITLGEFARSNDSMYTPGDRMIVDGVNTGLLGATLGTYMRENGTVSTSAADRTRVSKQGASRTMIPRDMAGVRHDALGVELQVGDMVVPWRLHQGKRSKPVRFSTPIGVVTGFTKKMVKVELVTDGSVVKNLAPWSVMNVRPAAVVGK